LPCLFKRKGR